MKRLLFILLFLPCTVLAVSDSIKIQNTTDVEDSWIYSTAASTNYGGADTMNIYSWSGMDVMRHVFVALLNLENHVTWADSHVVELKLFLYCEFQTSGPRVAAFVGAKPFYEPNITHLDWHSPDSEWTTAGCESTCDPVTYNRSDGTGCDRGSDTLDAVTVSAASQYYEWTLDTALANGYLAGTIDYLVFVFFTPSQLSSATFTSSEAASNQPYFQVLVDAQPSVGGDPNALRTPDGPGLLRSPTGGSVRHGP